MTQLNPALPAPIRVPVRQAPSTAGAAGQQTFRQAVRDVAGLREELRQRQESQAAAQRRYWQQVGPAAAAVVAARRRLYAPLEEALLLGYFSRLEEARIIGLLLGNARNLEQRFGEDEAVILGKYTPPQPSIEEPIVPAAAAAAATDSAQPAGARGAAEAILPPHEQQAAAARARRQTKTQRAREAAAQAETQQLAASTKTLYRQLARAHHPDLEPDPEQQATRTAQMQRIAGAYAAGDLHTLLELLAETSPITPDAGETLARYTRALHQEQISLTEQLNKLKYDAGIPVTAAGKRQERELRQIKRTLRAEEHYLAQLSQLLVEPAGLRELLRELSAAGQDYF